jgi:SsrA-binding protein
LRVLLSNRKKVHFNYSCTDDYIAGIKLLGSEVKSVRQKQCQFSSATVTISNGELFVAGMLIKNYSYSSQRVDETRSRKLLLKKREIRKIISTVNQKQLTVMPTEIGLEGNLIKVRIELCKRLKKIDKREQIKEKDDKRREAISLKDLEV